MRTRNRQRPEPQLAALIDVLAILIIFLVAGTVMGTSSLQIPENLKLPKSLSREALETAASVAITNDRILFSYRNQGYDLTQVLSPAANQEQERFRTNLSAYLADTKTNVINYVQLIADQATPYSRIYDVVSFLRKSGIESVMFISQVAEK